MTGWGLGLETIAHLTLLFLFASAIVDAMGLLKVTSLNVRGPNVPEKRSQLLTDLRKGKTQIAFLQETHFHGDRIPKLTNGAFPTAYHSISPISKSKGVSILEAKLVPWMFEVQRVDPQGRFLLLRGRVSDVQVTFANVYFPNVDHNSCGSCYLSY